MFNKKIHFYEEFVLIGSKKIYWKSIIGVRIIGNYNLLSFIFGKFPIIEFFLKNGKILLLSKNSIFLKKNKEKISIKEAISIINEKNFIANKIISNWVEWRLIITIAISEIISTFYCIIKGISSDKLVSYSIIAGLFASIVGFIWEKKARKNKINEYINKNQK